MDVGLILSTFSAVPLVLEIPTAAISDYFGSRNTMLLGMVLYLVGYVAILFKKNFFTFCLFYGLYGLYEAMFTGAHETLVYNNIKYLGIIDDFILHKNRSKIMQYAALLSSTIVAGRGMTGKISPNYLIVLDIVILLIYIAVVRSIEEHGIENLKKLNTNYLKSTITGLRYMFRHSSLRKIVMFRFVWLSFYKMFLHYAPTFYIDIWKSVGLASYMVPLEIFSAAVIQWLCIKYFTRRKNIYLDAKLFLLSSFSFMLSSLVYRGLFSYILIIIYFFSVQIGEVIFFVRMQRFIPAKSRAVIISACNFFVAMLRLVITLAMGFIAEKLSYQWAFVCVAAFFATSAIVFYISILRDRHISKIEKQLRSGTRMPAS
jgi:MFS family permease